MTDGLSLSSGHGVSAPGESGAVGTGRSDALPVLTEPGKDYSHSHRGGQARSLLTAELARATRHNGEIYPLVSLPLRLRTLCAQGGDGCVPGAAAHAALAAQSARARAWRLRGKGQSAAPSV